MKKGKLPVYIFVDEPSCFMEEGRCEFNSIHIRTLEDFKQQLISSIELPEGYEGNIIFDAVLPGWC